MYTTAVFVGFPREGQIDSVKKKTNIENKWDEGRIDTRTWRRRQGGEKGRCECKFLPNSMLYNGGRLYTRVYYRYTPYIRTNNRHSRTRQ